MNKPISLTLLSLHTLRAALLTLFTYNAAAAQPTSEHVNALRTQLEQLGWHVQHSARGDLLLWPPGQEDSAPAALLTPGMSSAEDSTAVMNLDALREKLIENGWDVRTNSDGSLLLYLTAAPTTLQKSEALTPPKPDHFDQLAALLHASGWEAKQDQSGNLTVYPQSAVASQRRDYTVLQVDNAALARLGDTLRDTGWRMQPQADGSFRVFADRRSEQRRKPEATSTASAEPAGTGSAVKVELPVDNLGKVRRIAQAWIRQQSRTDLVIGRIRRVHWVYLVDIFRNTPPYYLHNQLAIRHRDARVIPLL